MTRNDSVTGVPATASESGGSEVPSTSAAVRRNLDLTWKECKWPLFFLLSLSMMGLQFPPGFLLAIAILIRTFKADRYQFVVMLTLIAGGYGFINGEATYVKFEDIFLLAGVIGVFIFHQPFKLKRITLLYFIYCGGIIALSLTSEENFWVQFRLMRQFFMFIYFIIPIMCFADMKFEAEKLFRAIMCFVVLIACFFIIDVFIFHGRILIPNTWTWGDPSRFWDPDINIFSFEIPRKTDHGLFLVMAAIYPAARIFRLAKWQWIVIGLAILSTKTFSFVVPVFLLYSVVQPNRKLMMKLIIGCVSVLVLLFFIDPEPPQPGYDSPLRIRSSIYQFTSVAEMEDEEDLAKFASGRMAQAIPKLELLYDEGREWTGLGFLHPDLTTKSKYIIYNELLADADVREEVAAFIEIFPLNTLLRIGYIGLIWNLAFYIIIYFIIRRWKYSLFYLTIAVCSYLVGLGGTTGWGDAYSLFLMGLAVACSWLCEKNPPKQKTSTPITQCV